ncbi:MAG TPA: hypothetical protein VM204_04160 [Gaiellaceae bacterium]|nr:hypothetical protein [Gaiellaceae bacterium]
MTRPADIELASLEKIDPGELRLLWVNDGHDGPLEAVVEHAGACCLMLLHHEDATSDRPYRWLLVRLSREEKAEEERLHALYVEHVGEHWCFHGPTVEHPPPREEADPETFFAARRARAPVDVQESAVLGWADELPEL